MRRWLKIPSFHRMRRGFAVTAALLGLLVYANSASAFFPGKPCPKHPPKCDKPKCDDPKCPPHKPPHKPPPYCPPPPCDPPDNPPDPPPGDTIPEIDPGSMAGALGVLLSGALMITDRRRRK